MKTAIVIGATGLIGSCLVRRLLENPAYSKVIVFVRKPTGLVHEKLSERMADFTRMDTWREEIKGDVLFSALGTTLKTAGSKPAQWAVDYTCQLEAAKAAVDNGTDCLVLVSSAGASDRSLIFYSRMKGELERDIRKLPLPRIRILRPGILEGKRKESRPTEETSVRAMKVLGRIPFLRKYRPYPDHVVADAMIHAAEIPDPGCRVIELEQIFQLAGTGSL